MKDGSIFEYANLYDFFTLDPILEMESLDPANYFREDYFSEAVQYIEDASGPTEKKSFGKKILDLVKNLLRLIVKAFNAVVSFIKNLFKRKAKTVDQVLEKLRVKGAKVSSPLLFIY